MSKTLNSNSRWGSGGGGLTFPVAGEKNWDVWIETLVQALLDHDHSSNEKGREIPGGAITDATVTADKLLLNNNTYIRWKDDQAATKDIIGVDTSNNLTLGNVTMGASSDEGSKLVLGSGHQGSLELQKATLADNQSATSVPGFAVLAADESAFMFYSIDRGTSCQMGSLWISNTDVSTASAITEENVGEDAGVTFTVTDAGQLEYATTSTGTAASLRYMVVRG